MNLMPSPPHPRALLTNDKIIAKLPPFAIRFPHYLFREFQVKRKYSTMAKPARRPLVTGLTTNREDRRFYVGNRAFGRFGMRIFEPVTMAKPHWHGHVEANLCHNADMVYDVDGETIVIPAGTVIFFWAGVPHQLNEVRSINDAKAELCNIYLPLDSFLFMPHIARMQVALLGGAMIVIPPELCPRTLIDRWYRDYRANDVERMELVKMDMNALFRRVSSDDFIFIRKPWDIKQGASDLASAHVRHVVAMTRYVLENLAETLTSDKIAAVTGLNTNYALGLFSSTMHLPLKQFIIRMRLLRARSMLTESGIAISTVATRCGFNSITQFYDHFQRAYGATPNRVRQNFVAHSLTWE